MDLLEFQYSQFLRASIDTTSDGTLMTPHYLKAALVHLCKVDVDINPLTALATFVAGECDFTGYTAAVITWSTPTLGDDNSIEVIGTVPIFLPTDSVTPNTVYCMWITETTSAQLFFAGRFDDAPIPMGGTLNSLLLTVRYRPATKTVVVAIS